MKKSCPSDKITGTVDGKPFTEYVGRGMRRFVRKVGETDVKITPCAGVITSVSLDIEESDYRYGSSTLRVYWNCSENHFPSGPISDQYDIESWINDHLDEFFDE